MSEYEERKKLWQEVSLWLRVRRIPLRIYDNLPDYRKNLLHKCICVPVQTTTYRQRGDLIRTLFGSAVAGRDSVDPIDSAGEMEQLLSPLTEQEKSDYLSKF